ncbi:MAG: site-specific integrase [Fibrobacter sp.]|nr:site-specific integrase [Fibrobacter sp.]
MKLPSIRLVFDRKKKSSRKSLGLLQIEVMHQRKRKFISTGIKLLSHQWDNTMRVVNCERANEYNDIINSYLSKLNNFILSLVRDDGDFSFSKLDAYLKETGGISLVDFIIDAMSKEDYALRTTKSHHYMLSRLMDFCGDCPITEVDLDWIRRWDDYLRGLNLYKPTIYTLHTKLCKWMNVAVELGHIPSNPYKRFKKEKPQSRERSYLTDEEVMKIRNLDLEKPHKRFYRDMFLLQCYTGLSYSDLISLDFKKCIEKRNGKSIIVGRRKKTKQPYYIVLLSPALEIIERYNYSVEINSLAYYNSVVKEIAQLCGINKEVSSHVGRHTFAVWALNHGMPIEVVSKILGHTNIQTTQIYAKIVNKTIEDSFDRLEGLL